MKCRRILLPVLVLLLASCSGCAFLTLATLGTVLGALGSAASTGHDLYQLGKLNAAENVPYDVAIAAGRLAAMDLSLHPRAPEEHQGETILILHYADDQQAKLDVHLERRTKTMLRVRIDVGVFGSEPTAQLFMERMRIHLKALPLNPIPGTTRPTTLPTDRLLSVIFDAGPTDNAKASD